MTEASQSTTSATSGDSRPQNGASEKKTRDVKPTTWLLLQAAGPPDDEPTWTSVPVPSSLKITQARDIVNWMKEKEMSGDFLIARQSARVTLQEAVSLQATFH